MNSKTNSQINVDFPVRTRRSSNSIPIWFASMRNSLAHLSSTSRGFIMLLVLVLVATPSVSMLFPHRVTPANAAADVFSSERAMLHLPVIASEPHPTGSPAQVRVRDYLVGELVASGLEVQVQKTRGLENVVARLKGSNPTGAIVILTHYDTVSYSRGAGDNGSAVVALLEIMRTLAAGPTPLNDVIALFDDKEEVGPFAGTRAFVAEHPWMNDIRVAISIDSAIVGPMITNEVGPENNGWLVHALARAYNGGTWMSFSGGGTYNSTPFRQAGIPVLALEDNYPFRQKHTAEDVPEIISAASVQQMGDQTVSITRQLGSLDLNNPWGVQETFFSVPFLGFVHYPQAWSVPLAIMATIVLLLALGLALWRGIASWRGLAVALVAILLNALLAAFGINTFWKYTPGLMHWKTSLWQEWPEVIPPYGGWVSGAFGLFVLGLAVGLYILTRRWSSRADFSLAGLLPFTVASVALAFAEPRTAYEFTWPVLVGSFVWIAVLAT